MARRSRPAAPEPGVAFERTTRQRRAVVAAFEQAGHPLSVGDLVAAAGSAGEPLSLTTAYRTVRALVEEGSLAAVEVPGAGTFFERAGKAHHHHFSCMQCARVYELGACAATDVTLPPGFKAVSHETTVYGVCAQCAGRARKAPGAPRA
jgi:Fur family transcriptional regulator, ferric uptake regulator